jgi:hypothetical protein
MEIPAHIQVALNIGTPATAEQLEEAVSNWPDSQTTFGLSTDEFCAVAAEVEQGNDLIELSKSTRFPNDWHYLELVSEGVRQCFGVCTPHKEVGLPPTEVGQALLKGWFENSEIVDNTTISEGILVIGTAPTFAHRDFSRQLIKTWAEVSPQLEGGAVLPIWVTNTQLVIGQDARILTAELRYGSLFVECVSEVKTKWRYFSLYHILEHGYLFEVFSALKSDFFFSPKESLSAALAAVDSELNQFISLAETAGLQPEFEAFFDQFELAKGDLNRFAIAVDRSIQQSGQLKKAKGKWQHGVLACYKIRCAIVHAGVSAPIFDSYPDGPACLEMVLPTFESVCLKFLGITVA